MIDQQYLQHSSNQGTLLFEMTDRLTAEQRSALMSRVRNKDTKPERLVRSLIYKMGYRFRLHRKDLPGRPDIVLSKHKKVVFVHGCYWHQHIGCPRSKRPLTRIEFWNSKLDRNIERDKIALVDLHNLEWSVLVLWECQLKNRDSLMKILGKRLINSTLAQPVRI